MNTNWSTPKTNIFSGINELRKALASGYDAKLIREWNEKCEFPIRKKNHIKDFKCYEFNNGHISTKDEILADTHMSDFEKYLTLNYKACFGSDEAMNTYYTTGVVCADNFRGVGRCHLVRVQDMVEFFEKSGDTERAKIFREQYITGETANENHFWDFFRLKNGNNEWTTKKFKHKLWVVVLEDKNEKPKIPVAVHIMNAILYPFKFIPSKSVLRLDEYTLYTFRIGSIYHGFKVEIQIPKKFSFHS